MTEAQENLLQSEIRFIAERVSKELRHFVPDFRAIGDARASDLADALDSLSESWAEVTLPRGVQPFHIPETCVRNGDPISSLLHAGHLATRFHPHAPVLLDTTMGEIVLLASLAAELRA